MSAQALADRIEAAIGRRPLRLAPLSGGCVAEIQRADLPGGERIVAKSAAAGDSLALEAYMLRYLGQHSRLPVPGVLYVDETLLLIDYVETSGALDQHVEAHAVELLADLHSITATQYGHERDTLIGGLPQPNPQTASWLAFFRDWRLLHMGRAALDAGRLPARTFARLETLCGRLERWIEAPAAPTLIHGDLWRGNVLVRDGRIAAFIDPALYYADPEIELAFSTLFSTFGPAFFRRYGEIRTLRPGFFETRRDLYNLYPLLVHVRLFGGGYVGSVERILGRFGC